MDLKSQTVEQLEAKLKELTEATIAIRNELISRVGASGISMEEIQHKVLDVYMTSGIVPAVRKYRELTGCSLREAHEAVENRVKTYRKS